MPPIVDSKRLIDEVPCFAFCGVDLSLHQSFLSSVLSLTLKKARALINNRQDSDIGGLAQSESEKISSPPVALEMKHRSHERRQATSISAACAPGLEHEDVCAQRKHRYRGC